MAEQSIADLTLARINVAISKLETITEIQRDHTARLSAIEARIGAVETRLEVWNERIARLEARGGLSEAPPS